MCFRKKDQGERQQKLKKGELDASGVLPVIDVEGRSGVMVEGKVPSKLRRLSQVIILTAYA